MGKTRLAHRRIAFCGLAVALLLWCGFVMAGCQGESDQKEESVSGGEPIEITCPSTSFYTIDEYLGVMADADLPEDADARTETLKQISCDMAQEALEGIGATDITFEEDEAADLFFVSATVPEGDWRGFADSRREDVIEYLNYIGVSFPTDQDAPLYAKPTSIEINDQLDEVVLTFDSPELLELSDDYLRQGYGSVRALVFEPLYWLLNDYNAEGSLDELIVTFKDADGEVIIDNSALAA